MSHLASTIASAGFLNLGNIGPTEIIIFLAIVLLIFGPKRLPQLARAMGQSIKDFKKGLNEVKQDIESADQEDTTPAASQPVPPVAVSKDAKPSKIS